MDGSTSPWPRAASAASAYENDQRMDSVKPKGERAAGAIVTGPKFSPHGSNFPPSLSQDTRGLLLVGIERTAIDSAPRTDDSSSVKATSPAGPELTVVNSRIRINYLSPPNLPATKVYKHWTQQEQEYMEQERAKDPPTSWQSIGAALGRGVDACKYRWMIRKDGGRYSNLEWTAELDAELLQKREEGMTMREIAKDVGTSLMEIARRNKQLRQQETMKMITPVSPVPRGGTKGATDSEPESPRTPQRMTTSTPPPGPSPKLEATTPSKPSPTAAPAPAHARAPTATERAAARNHFTDEDDEVLLRLYLLLLDPKDFAKEALPGKSKKAVEERLSLLTRRNSFEDPLPEMYARLMWRWNQGGEPWTREEVIERRFKVGEWKAWGTQNLGC
ncbi:hypothetical protein CC80DRAFT_593253 [Byssothecium circinans]|uniref:Myb-like domain-containing protein n=1 Tax=Byssothecium circinans TaxID=147558 RepID=A0A6A5TV54_9PLEO|nr:hypothetical protein CC80DRAFT_593253 [Byssothecium circinans]